MKNPQGRNGIIIRFPFSLKKTKDPVFKVGFSEFCSRKIAEGRKLGYSSFIFELTEDDFKILDFSPNLSLEEYLIHSLEDNNIRIAIHIKSKKHITSDSEDDVDIAIQDLRKCIEYIKGLDAVPQMYPIILHIGGAKGDRKLTMEKFCKTLEDNFISSDLKYLSVINDDKPSLFSVKDLLPGVFYRLKIPIVFRSTSYPTNQGNLTLNESLFLSASTWDRSINPIFVYLPAGTERLEEEQTSPFGLQLDIVFDNIIPEPK